MLTLETAWADGTRQLVFEPLELLEKLAALTPQPRIIWCSTTVSSRHIGNGGLRLLSSIATTGSLAGAVREVGWSYRHAGGYIRRAEEVLGSPLPGGDHGFARDRAADVAPHVARHLFGDRGGVR